MVPEQTSATELAPEVSPRRGLGFSELLGRVFGQLSLSAWLPAAMIVGASALLIQVHGQVQLNIAHAILRLTKQPLGILVVLVFALILTTIVTQAFEFEVIRFLEGYWGPGPARAFLSNRRINYHLRKRQALERYLKEMEQEVFGRARPRMLAAGIDRVLVDILEHDVLDLGHMEYADEKIEEARSMGWQFCAEPAELRRLAAIAERLDCYPDDFRILPTILGNTLRATEDQLKLADGGDLQGLVIRNYSLIPPLLRNQHAQFRTRLDMYCTLVMVFAVLAIESFWALWRFGLWHESSCIVAAGFVLMSLVSYGAAISSARGYGAILKAVDAAVASAVRV
jgi:hypothetical protein